MSITDTRPCAKPDAGQTCTASSRVYVQKTAAEQFKKLVAQIMQNLRLGDPRESNTDMGPQADSKQAAAVARYLEAGAQDGQALVGGKRALERGENFIYPTVFSNIPHKSKLDVEEIFGPVMVLHEFETEEEAVQRANDTECELERTRCFLISANIVLTLASPRRIVRLGLHEGCQQSFAGGTCSGSRQRRRQLHFARRGV